MRCVGPDDVVLTGGQWRGSVAAVVKAPLTPCSDLLRGGAPVDSGVTALHHPQVQLSDGVRYHFSNIACCDAVRTGGGSSLRVNPSAQSKDALGSSEFARGSGDLIRNE